MSDGGFCHDEAEPKEPCDGNGECFRLSADISRLEAENVRLRDERDVYERRWRDIYDIPLARLQLPDGSVPGGTVECAEAWHRIARERTAKLSALIASVRETVPVAEDALRLLRYVRVLDCGAHYCRYCPAKSPDWEHTPGCPYVESQETHNEAFKLRPKLQSILAALQQAIGDTQ